MSKPTIEDLRRTRDRLRRERDKAEGAYEAAMADLKEDFDCDTLQQAEDEYDRLSAEEQKLCREYERLRDAFAEEWAVELAKDRR